MTGIRERRVRQVKMDKPPQVVARPAPFPDEDGNEKPAVKFPVKFEQ